MAIQDTPTMRALNRDASETLKILGKLAPFVEAMNSEKGQELLKDDVMRHQELLEKIYNEKESDQERAEFRYLKLRLKVVSERLSRFDEGMAKVKEKK